MPWVRFLENYDWQPKDAKWMIAYKKDAVYLVKRVVAEEAVAKGKAVLIERPKNASR